MLCRLVLLERHNLAEGLCKFADLVVDVDGWVEVGRAAAELSYEADLADVHEGSSFVVVVVADVADSESTLVLEVCEDLSSSVEIVDIENNVRMLALLDHLLATNVLGILS